LRSGTGVEVSWKGRLLCSRAGYGGSVSGGGAGMGSAGGACCDQERVRQSDRMIYVG